VKKRRVGFSRLHLMPRVRYAPACSLRDEELDIELSLSLIVGLQVEKSLEKPPDRPNENERKGVNDNRRKPPPHEKNYLYSGVPRGDGCN